MLNVILITERARHSGLINEDFTNGELDDYSPSPSARSSPAPSTRYKYSRFASGLFVILFSLICTLYLTIIIVIAMKIVATCFLHYQGYCNQKYTFTESVLVWARQVFFFAPTFSKSRA